MVTWDVVSVRVNKIAENSRSHGTNFPHFCLADDLIDILELQGIRLLC